MKYYNSCEPSIIQQEINEFLNIDNENRLEYIQSIMEEVNALINGKAVINAKTESSDDETEAGQINEDEQVPLLDQMIFIMKNACIRGSDSRKIVSS